MDALTAMNVVVDELFEMNDIFSDVAMGDGLAPILMVAGTLLIVFSLAAFGFLTLGAVGSLFTSD